MDIIETRQVGQARGKKECAVEPVLLIKCTHQIPRDGPLGIIEVKTSLLPDSGYLLLRPQHLNRDKKISVIMLEYEENNIEGVSWSIQITKIYDKPKGEISKEQNHTGHSTQYKIFN